MIAGNLNFGTVPGMMDYGGAYANALSLNQQNYNNILAGYQQLMSGQMAAQGGIQKGYSTLSTAVLKDIADVGASQQQAINDAYAQQSGSQAQSLISRGLGNTTVQNSVQRGLTLDKQKADIALANQMAQLTAGYRSNLGLAGLNYANQANMQNTALGGQQLGFMNSVTAKYPDPEAYARMAMMRGAASVGARPGTSGYGLPGGGYGGGGRSNVPLIWPRSPQGPQPSYGSGGVNIPALQSPYQQSRPGSPQSTNFGGESYGGAGGEEFGSDVAGGNVLGGLASAAFGPSGGNYGAGNIYSAYEQAGGNLGPSAPGQQAGYDYGTPWESGGVNYRMGMAGGYMDEMSGQVPSNAYPTYQQGAEANYNPYGATQTGYNEMAGGSFAGDTNQMPYESYEGGY